MGSKSPSAPPIKAALLGLGRIAWSLESDPRREKPATHAGALARLPGVILTGAWDSSPEARREFLKGPFGTWGQTSWKSRYPWESRMAPSTDFQSAAEMLETLRPDLVCVATWPDSHYELVKACVDSDVGAVVCEKPLAPTLEEARKIAALEGTGPSRTRILVNHERRYARDWQWIKARMDQKTYGEVLSLRGRLYLGRSRKPGLTLLHDGTHLVDILRYLTGKEWTGTSVTGDPLEPGGTLIYLGKMGDLPTVLEIGGGRDHMVFEVEVNTSRGRLVVGNGVLQAWESRPAAWASGFRSLAPRKVPRFQTTGYFLNMMTDAAACARDVRRIPFSQAADGLAALETIGDLLGLSGLSLEDLRSEAPDSHKPQV